MAKAKTEKQNKPAKGGPSFLDEVPGGPPPSLEQPPSGGPAEFYDEGAGDPYDQEPDPSADPPAEEVVEKAPETAFSTSPVPTPVHTGKPEIVQTEALAQADEGKMPADPQFAAPVQVGAPSAGYELPLPVPAHVTQIAAATPPPIYPADEELPFYWDPMMAAVSTSTRDAIWEQGVMDMPTLLRTSIKTLLAPKGKLQPQHVEELNLWLQVNVGRSLTMNQSQPTGRSGSGTRVPTNVVTGAGALDRRVARQQKHQRAKKTY